MRPQPRGSIADWNNAFPDRQCRGKYPSLMRPSIETARPAGRSRAHLSAARLDGLNHYSRVYVRAHPSADAVTTSAESPAGPPLTSIGWPIQPEAFGETLRTVHEAVRSTDLRS